MKTLLVIKTSIFSDNGASSRLAEQFATRFRAAHPEGEVIVRDLALDPVPHLDAARFSAFITPAAQRSPEQQSAVRDSDALIEELRSADVIALGLPMYNFGVPSMLKAYFDHIARAGVTFRYTQAGPEGLLTGKQAYVFAARGGVYAGTPRDTQSAYIRDFLGFVGVKDVEFIYAEGLSMGEQSKRTALANARAAVDQLILAAPARAAA